VKPRLLLDTDILVDYLRGDERARDLVLREADAIAVSAITVAELYAGARTEAESLDLDELLAALPVIEVGPDIARQAGLLKATFGRSHGVGIADAVIAATARVHALALATLNVRHYPMIAGLRPPYTKD
jgi:predicted nucleic acid-binding protein